MIWSGAVLVVVAVTQSHHLPPELLRTGDATIQLARTPTFYATLTWAGQSVNIEVAERPSAQDTWDAPVRRTETLVSHLTAIAPLYSETSGMNDSFYVIGVDDYAVTQIEKWKLVFQRNMQHKIIAIAIQKQQAMTSAALTHLRACAAAPNGHFLMAQRHETGEIIRIDLDTKTHSTILTASAYPNLVKWDRISWMKHGSQGHVFVMNQGRRVSTLDTTLLLWDGDLDGTPNSVEEISSQTWEARGYRVSANWVPISFFDL